jgi:hypothetical protein
MPIFRHEVGIFPSQGFTRRENHFRRIGVIVRGLQSDDIYPAFSTTNTPWCRSVLSTHSSSRLLAPNVKPTVENTTFSTEPLVPKMTSMLIALITCPALLATSEAIRQGQTKDRREEHRARRSNLIVSCVEASPRRREIDHQQVALKNNKVATVSNHLVHFTILTTFDFSYT